MSEPLNPFGPGAELVASDCNAKLEEIRAIVRKIQAEEPRPLPVPLAVLIAAIGHLDHALSTRKGDLPDDWVKGRVGYCTVCQKAPRVLVRDGECDICYTIRQTSTLT